jgi:hypothetical protein
MTKNGVEYNLRISPYTVKNEFQMRFNFSTVSNKMKFIERQKSFREEFNVKMENRFDINIKSDIMADLMLYQAIEKRGFLCEVNGSECTCINQMAISLQIEKETN